MFRACLCIGRARRSTDAPVTSLRIPPAMLARADELVPLIAATGELVNARRCCAWCLLKGLRVLGRRYASGS